MSYREEDPAMLRAEVERLRGENERLRQQLDARPGRLARAWALWRDWWCVGLAWLAVLGAVAGVAGAILRDAARDRDICERACGGTPVDVRDDLGLACLCDRDDRLEVVRPWEGDQ